jgi:oligogalacturonide lyase
MFGPAYVLGVEVAKAVNPKPSEVVSTPALAKRYNPTVPEDTHAIPK